MQAESNAWLAKAATETQRWRAELPTAVRETEKKRGGNIGPT
jgi:hypothetical protein